jgi:arsenite methyltransferase
VAELDRETTACCSTGTQDTCCAPSEKEGCCAEGQTLCGCDGPQEDVREHVRARYAAAAGAISQEGTAASAGLGVEDRDGREVFGGSLYEEADRQEAPVAGSLGCGVPTAVADLAAGETVLDLGSGAGADVLISARRVGPTGKAIGLDMTDEMLALARRNAERAGVENVEFRAVTSSRSRSRTRASTS